jgi:hypothetical protein
MVKGCFLQPESDIRRHILIIGEEIMEKLPQYAVELVQELDIAIPYVEFPLTLDGLEDLSERKIRRLAFLAGQRALVDDLMTLIKEDEDAGNGTNSSGGDHGGGSGWDYVQPRTDGEGTEEDQFGDRS